MTMRCRVPKSSVRTPITKIRVIAGKSELRALGQADTSIANLERHKLIRREPGRAATVPLFSPAAF